MHDPIGGFERIRDLYLTYLETAFRIRDEDVSAERRHLLEQPGQLCTDPLVEPVPRYASSGVALHDLVEGDAAERVLPGFDRRERLAFAEIALSGLFDSKPAESAVSTTREAAFPLYEHQATMLTKGVQEGEPGIVTSGTGSGKTESFLLPVLASIIREATSWPKPSGDYLKRPWWHGADGKPVEAWGNLPDRPTKQDPDASPFRLHRDGESEGRPAAVRALILYPMNALVEDQLTRIRKALDSDEAHAAMDVHLDGNRIFFGRYTSSTPVTNYHVHPRPDDNEYKRRARKLERLHEEMLDAERTQIAAREHDAEHPDDDPTRYLFPSTDGAELVSRWDMQQTPPDVLVTNTSMLNAMLVREVEADVFKKTRSWIESDPNAYFYLVLDELHLQRGSAGTEVAYMLRVLLDRLGLTAPEHRHKLRILASSASLPVEGEERERSLKYLFDAFGTHGAWRQDAPPPQGPQAWSNAVVPGDPVEPTPLGEGVIPTAPFLALLDAYGDPERLDLDPPGARETLWRDAADALGLDVQGPIEHVAAHVVAEAGARVAKACVDEHGSARATPLPELAERLFGQEADPDGQAIRGLLVARGVGDGLRGAWASDEALKKLVDEAPSFRVHTFFRAVEGLFAAPDEASEVDECFHSKGRSLGPLSIERGERFSKRHDESRGHRMLEVLYCECCGDLFYGGRRGEVEGVPDVTELLPHEADLGSLPDASRTLLFEDLSYDDYAVFWPSTRPPAEKRDGEPEAGDWVEATLDPATGVVRRSRFGDGRGIRGQVYSRGEDFKDTKHQLGNDDEGTAVPFACPYCGTNYGGRRRSMRLSPVRSFRAGFAKTTQILVTELYDVLRLGHHDAKLISFSDSRQEAARAALDVEAGHHADLRRDLLVAALRQAASERSGDDAADLLRLEQEAGSNGDYDLAKHYQQRRLAAEAGGGDDAIPLAYVVESSAVTDFKTTSPGKTAPLRPFIAEFVRLGLHPTDDAGVEPVKATLDDGSTRDIHWADLFELRGEGDGAALEADWKEAETPSRTKELDAGRGWIVAKALTVLSDALFSRNYFALEETGIGYPCVLGQADGLRSETDAFLRVFTDAYRLQDSPWAKEGEPGPSLWDSAAQINKRNRVRAFATSVWTEGEVESRLDDLLRRLAKAGHPGGLVATAALGVRLVDAEAPYWRCAECGRVHLHRGAGVCTRCFKKLPQGACGTAAELRDRHYVAKRVERVAPPFRLRCEELTGQTHDPADRQRRFRGVVLDAVASGAAVPDTVGDTLRRRASIVDLLTVTTTMEVGVDVGSLQATVQANMPPQRFNYQQRVGRAGRRRQAFSFVLTVCRNRSHDLHYFRHPKAITGDAPPPPFLSKDLPDPALRFVRKAWLWEAFRRVRDSCAAEGIAYPGDSLRPPDVHGEFVPTKDFFAPDSPWKSRLRGALVASLPFKDHLVSVLGEDTPLPSDALDLTADDLLNSLEAVVDGQSDDRLEATAAGLGQTLAEAGLLPMLGMPTRVRDLYYEADVQKDGRTTWKTVDRDLDVAIFEFAPGAVLINDKRQLTCIGFTGPLPNRAWKPKGQPTSKKMYFPQAPALGEPFWLVECVSCSANQRFEDKPDPADPPVCRSCGETFEVDSLPELRVPNGFRTDLEPHPFDPEARSPRRSGWGVVAESHPVAFCESDANLAVTFEQRMRTYKVNRGPQGDDREGYSVGQYRDWKFAPGKTAIARQVIARQAFSGDADIVRKLFDVETNDPDAIVVESLHLAAPKTTDALFLAPRATHPHLALLPRDAQGERVTAVRAAALSAAFLLTYRAAEALDIDPDELEVVEPRVVGIDGARVPLLQLTDQLVNGAGYCKQLSESLDGVPLVLRLLASIVGDRTVSPLADLLEPDHVKKCDPACYRCLQRYGNQSYHGLLDWRLGLAYLQALLNPSYACGLEGDTAADPALADWLSLAEDYAQALVDFDGTGAVRRVEGLVAFQVQKTGPWALVVHPLWSLDAPAPLVSRAVAQLKSEGVAIRFVDSFKLSRTALTVRDDLRKK